MPASTIAKTDGYTPDEWEALCQRCGDCCFEKSIDKQGKPYTMTLACRFLDIHTRECRVYHQRQQAEEDCIKLTRENIAGFDWLPASCAYRALLDTSDSD